MTVRILSGDCREVLRTLEDNSVQCVVTSPPYYGLRDYGVDGQIGLEQSPDAYVAEMVAVFREVMRVLRDDGVLFLNLGDSYSSGNRTSFVDDALRGPKSGARVPPIPGIKPKDMLGIPWRVAFALQTDGWYLRQDIIWAKPNPMPESVTDRCTKSHEYVFLLSKSAKYFWDANAIAEAFADERMGQPGSPSPKTTRIPGQSTHTIGTQAWASNGKPGRNKRSVWTIASQPFSGSHFATMPPELAETCIRAGSSEKGQCPHCGAPWARTMVHTGRKICVPDMYGRPRIQELSGNGETSQHKSGVSSGFFTNERKHTGWSQTCKCPEHRPVPQIILDPFGGAGTTALVADRIQREAVIIELNPQYALMARDRIKREAGLFASVAAE